LYYFGSCSIEAILSAQSNFLPSLAFNTRIIVLWSVDPLPMRKQWMKAKMFWGFLVTWLFWMSPLVKSR